MKYHSGTYQSESKAAETLDNSQIIHYNIQAIGVWRSLVSRMVRVHEAAGSNPATPTMQSVLMGSEILLRTLFFYFQFYTAI